MSQEKRNFRSKLEFVSLHKTFYYSILKSVWCSMTNHTAAYIHDS